MVMGTTSPAIARCPGRLIIRMDRVGHARRAAVSQDGLSLNPDGDGRKFLPYPCVIEILLPGSLRWLSMVIAGCPPAERAGILPRVKRLDQLGLAANGAREVGEARPDGADEVGVAAAGALEAPADSASSRARSSSPRRLPPFITSTIPMALRSGPMTSRNSHRPMPKRPGWAGTAMAPHASASSHQRYRDPY